MSAWLEWLRERRFGGDDDLRAEWLAELAKTRDRVLDNAHLEPGETLLDVGAGEGLIGFGALERGAGEVTFVDIEQQLLDACREAAERLQSIDRCRFVLGRAEDLSAIEDGSVDVVATRSVLIFVEDKRSAFREFHRVLAQGGRISLFEPINRLNRFGRAYDLGPVQELEERVRALYERLQPRESDPMLDFDDRDLVDLAEQAGFGEVHLTLEVEVKPPDPRPWDAFVNIAWNPKIPTLAEAMAQVLSPEERERYTSVMRPLVEQGRGSMKMATAFLSAIKR